MSEIGNVLERKERPALVRFERIAIEDKAATLREGRWCGKDVDIAMVTPPYSKDVFRQKVDQWFATMAQEVMNNRLPREWFNQYKEDYALWKKGQEVPLHGTPIKGWGMISPAQQEVLIKINVLTVEDLAVINDEGCKRIGMGSLDLKNKAIGWLSQVKDKGPLTQEIAAVKAENEVLKKSVETLTRQVQELTAMVRASNYSAPPPQAAPIREETIEAKDILEEPVAAQIISFEKEKREIVQEPTLANPEPNGPYSELKVVSELSLAEQYKAKFGKPPDGRWSDKKIAEALK